MSISLCIVARNEASFINDCIRSASSICDEVILVDTGSTDATREIARKAGARVVRKPWPGDLGRAHALPLACARCDWVLSLDGDELLHPDSGDKIRALTASRSHEGYLFTIRNYLYDPNTKWRGVDSSDPLVKGALGYCPNVAVRLFRRREAYRYEGHVHQSIASSILARGGKIGVTDVPIHHYGLIRFDRAKSPFYAALARRQVVQTPASARAWIDLGIAFLEDKHSAAPAAAAAFYYARSLGERPTASYFLGRALIEMRQSAAAIPFLQEAIRGNPRDELIFFDRADAWELLAAAFELTGNADRARNAYRQALRTRADSPIALNNLADLLGERGSGKEAFRLVERLLQQYRGFGMAWATLGNVRFRSGELEGACRAFETALDINPENLAARLNLAMAYEQLGQRGKAQRAYLVTREVSDSPEAWTLGLAAHLPFSHRPKRIRLRPLGNGGVVNLIGHLAGGGGRVLVDAVLAFRGRPQLVLCADPGAYTGQELRAEIAAAGAQLCTVNTDSGVTAILNRVQPEVVIHHWSKGPAALRGPLRTGAERWIAIGHAALPMPFGYDAYVAISAFHENFQRHLPSERLVRISNGVRLGDFKAQRRRRRSGPVRIVMLSRLAAGKFPRRLLEFLPPLHELGAQLLVAGFGRRRFEIEPELSARGLEDAVSFIGPIPSAQVPQFLGDADIGLHLTDLHEELCPLAILEMMAAGLPIVAQPKGCLPEMIVHAKNGFLSSEEGAIAEYLQRLIASPQLRQRLGAASRRMARRYDFAHFQKSLQKLVAKTTRRPSAPRAEQTLHARGRLAKWRPSLCYLVCATPRSGSNLLCEALTISGLAGWPEEVFCRSTARWTLPEWGETSDILQYLEWLFEDRSAPNGVFGAKIMLNDFLRLCAELRKKPASAAPELACAFPGLRYIWMRRRDTLRQAISRTRANQTGHWRQHDGHVTLALPKPRFDRDEILQSQRQIEIEEATWQTFFDSSGIDPVVVWYEDVVGSYQATALRVLKNLGIKVPRRVWFGERRLLSQSDSTTEKWMQRLAGRTGKARKAKLALEDVTFLIPVHLDSPDRIRNLRQVIRYLTSHLSTRIIVGEQGTPRIAALLRDLGDAFEVVRFRTTARRFHRTHLLNQMLALVRTPFVCNYDCDVLFPLSQYASAVSLLRTGAADFVFPFDGCSYDVPAVAQDRLIAALPERARQRETFENLNPGDVSVGGAFMARTEVYRECGGENRAFVGWGWEDRERVVRFAKLGKRILRVPGDCFHLQHARDGQQSAWDIRSAVNRREYKRIAALSPKRLRVEVATWRRL